MRIKINKVYYDENSKILESAIQKLKKKGAFIGNFEKGFRIPGNLNFLLDIIKTKNLKKK